MALHPCSSCGRPINPSQRCPHCGALNPLDDELARIDASIREMNLRDMAIVKERSQLASKLQAAKFQRDILAHANAERGKETTRPRRVRRRRPATARPTGYEPGPGTMTDGVTQLVDDPPPVEPTVAEPPPTAPPVPTPEASSRSVQNITLALGALLLGVAAVVFAGVAVSTFDALGRAAILAAAAAAALVAAPGVARRELTTTAETVAAVGLTLLPMAGYALHGTALFAGRVSEQLFLGVTFALTALFSYAYAGSVPLAVPRYATVLALQPVPTLLGYELIHGPAGWALVFTITAALDLLLITTAEQRGRLVPRWPDTVPMPPDAHDDDHARYEAAPEEPDLVIDALGPPRRRWWRGRPDPVVVTEAGPRPPSAAWLREMTFGLLVAAVTAALLYAGGALLGADTVGDAVRSGLILVAAAAVGAAAAQVLGNLTARQVAGAVLVLAVIAAVARIVAVAAPGWGWAAAAAAVVVTGAAARFAPEEVRRGPQYASAAVLTVVTVVVGLDVLRAAVAPVGAARPVWQADPATYQARLTEAAGGAGAALLWSALLLTLAAAVALPRQARHPGAVVGVALTALAVPAALVLGQAQAPWPLVAAAAGLGLAGLAARERRTAVTHVAAAGIVGLFGAGAALSAPWLTAAALAAITGTGIMVAILATQLPTRLYAWLVGDWAQGAAAFALPGVVAAAGVAGHSDDGPAPTTPDATVPVLAATFVAVAVTLGYAAVRQVARREVSTPLTLGTGLGALAVTVAAFRADGAAPADVWVGALLMVAAVLLFFAPTIDANRRADRMVDGPDVAAAAATVAIIGALARVTALVYPTAALAAAAAVVLIVGVGVRSLPPDWRRGPVLGAAVGGAVILAAAGWTALSGGLRILALPGPLWDARLEAWAAVPQPGAWQAPVALLLLAVAAATALPRPWNYDTSGLCVVLAVLGVPAALGLPWWSPLVIGGAVGLGYAVAAVAAQDPRAALARASVAGAVLLHAAGAGLARPDATAAALLIIMAVGLIVALLARVLAPVGTSAVQVDDVLVDLAVDDTGMPRYESQLGGAATAAVLLALPGVFAAAAAAQGEPAAVVLTAALAASSFGLAALAVVGRRVPQYLPWATVGLVGGATVTAIASLPTDRPTALYAAAAALLGVVAELLRGSTRAPGVTVTQEPLYSPSMGTRPRWYAGPQAAPRWTALRPMGLRGRWSVDPATGAVAVAAAPTLLALISIAPALVAVLVDPFQQLGAIWRGPVPALADPALAGRVDATSALAAVLLTAAAALAALGFGGRPAEVVPVVLPGLAVTLLITPVAVGAPWPASTGAGLAVFTISMLGLALTPPPVATHARLLRATRGTVFVIGLLGGGAGLAGSLATRQLTLFTLGSAVMVGLVAAIGGRTQVARLLGWLFAAGMAHSFALTACAVAGLAPAWWAFGALAVGTALLVLEAVLPRLGRVEHLREATTVEWSGYASALLALALAYDSPRHLAALLAAWGAVLGLTATRAGRRRADRRMLFWIAVAFEVGAWWLLMTLSDVVLPEAYTLPFALLAMLVGALEARHRPELSSWAAYGPALLAAFVPTLGIVLTTDTSDLRELLLLLGGVATLLAGSRLQQQAPVVVGAVVTAVAALHFVVTLVGPWLVLVPVGVFLLLLGASNENRRRTQTRLRGALTRMR